MTFDDVEFEVEQEREVTCWSAEIQTQRNDSTTFVAINFFEQIEENFLSIFFNKEFFSVINA